MYSNPHAAMPPPQARSVAPETFLLDQDAQQSLPPDSIVALQQVDNLKYFLISAPVDWSPDQYIRRFLLPTGEYVSCVLWNNLFHISGTDIVRCLSFRFQAFGRPVKNSKKFEEGIFSDLRNLKSGTDASLEEPKSAFLDFLYKNNCIRTQKKQKVFYWYSVPHDRLFLDALERDLKREKMGQEATTVAVSEPALSFEFDSSQSLFEQLTKAQQTNSSSFNTNVQQYSQSTSPIMRAIDSMPPPQMVPPQSMPPQMHQDTMGPTSGYQQMSMPDQMGGVIAKREREYQPQVQYDRNGIPLSQVHTRHSSMPAYMEYSPAPSFVSSHYEDYSTRGISFEPLTPPQHSINLGAEPAYIANDETGLYSAIPDLGQSQTFNPLMQLPPSNMSGPQYNGMTRGYPPANVYSVIEGSPTYKQRRRRSSMSTGVSAAVTATGGGATHTVHRPSDLRRSMSSSVVPVAEADESGHNSPQSVNNGYSTTIHQPKELLELSRHGTPLATVEDSPVQQPLSLLPQDDLSSFTTGDSYEPQLHHNAVARAASAGGSGGVYRRARSATMMELGPYPQKSHSCPIPTCGRLFKRLEHLKRHVRTHTQERPYVCSLCNKAFSRSDNLAQHRRTHEQNSNGEPLNFSEEDLEGEDDNLVSLEEESPESEHAYLATNMGMPTSMAEMQSMNSMHGMNGGGGLSMNGGSMSMGQQQQQQLVAAQNY
ncbi:STE-domain-containing protein [Aulographum hederae CBS 113979]|uniref:STE-domain-containing protein n=1 Tax=Aulographum hederae CBS 113979 TaxID=1176131 RepID=A0A6G1GYJ3_9PEZI|nr:STE-domain-containing protein [Aulographum hederae CBS 113979]